MAYRIEYDAGVARSIERLPKGIRRRIITRIGMLADNPRPPGGIKLAGQMGYRVRVGDYRIIYNIYDDRLIVLIVDVGDRKDVYRRR